MTKSSESAVHNLLAKLAPKGIATHEIRLRDPRIALRLVIGVLLLANLVAAGLVFFPIGGSPEQMEEELASLRSKEAQDSAKLAAIKSLAGKIEKGRKEGDDFVARYFLPRRTASSLLLSELLETAQQAGIRAKAHQYTVEPLEGSESISLLTISGNYQGTYADLVHFLNTIDRADRLLIIDSMAASPTNTPDLLNVNMKIHTFIQDDGSGPPPLPSEEQPNGQNADAGQANPREG